MAHYIKSMIDELNQRLDNRFTSEGIRSRFIALIAEADRLDPRDFQPAHRFEFVDLRRKIKNYGDITDENWEFIINSSVRPNKSSSAGGPG